MQKEILTRENIITDLKCRLFKEIIELILALFLLPLASYFLVNVISLFKHINQSFKYSVWVICCLLLFSMLIYSAVNTFSALIHIDKFVVENDFVIKKLHARGGLYTSNRLYTLCFSSNTKYEIHSGKHYKWSNLFEMSDKEVYNSSNINDDFYLISVGKRKNIVGYNKKIFNMQ